MDSIKIPKSVLREHPLYQRERGMHLPWYRRGRIPAMVALPLIAALGVADTFLIRSSVQITDDRFQLPIMYLCFYVGLLIRQGSVDLRFMDLKTSGLFLELYLTPWTPLETHGSFRYGNRLTLWEYLLAVTGATPLMILLPWFGAWLAVAIAVGFLIRHFTAGGGRIHVIVPSQEIWMLEAGSYQEVLLGVATAQWWFLIIEGIPFLAPWAFLLILPVGIALAVRRLQKHETVLSMNERETSDYIGRIYRGETPAEARRALDEESVNKSANVEAKEGES